jgi:uncharacterized protein YqeY
MPPQHPEATDSQGTDTEGAAPEATDTQATDAEATGDIRARMRRGLVAAMKARDQQAVAALRSTLARIDNAEAVDADAFDPEEEDAELLDADRLDDEAVAAAPAPYRGAGHPAVAGSVLGVGAAEVDRRVLTPEEMAAIVRDDVEEREVAADVLERVGRPDQAERLRAQAKLLTTYLAPPTPPPA